jgi:molecular chaperone GrpE
MEREDETKDTQAGQTGANPAETGTAGPVAGIAREEFERLCKEQVCPDCPEQAKAAKAAAQAEDERLRALAETDNVRKRLAREKEEFLKFAVEGVLGDLLPVLDNLDLAIAHGKDNQACRDLLMGVQMTRKVFLDQLIRHGLEPVGEAGEPFNPEWHEAVGFDQDKNLPDAHVCRVVQGGYRLRGRLLRPAKVLVNKTC